MSKELHIGVGGMSCASCVTRVERAIASQPGVESATVALIPLAAGLFYPMTGWLLNPMLAAAAMSVSSLFVVTNSLRLRRFRPRVALPA
jgi:cation transport ATPase